MYSLLFISISALCSLLVSNLHWCKDKFKIFQHSYAFWGGGGAKGIYVRKG